MSFTRSRTQILYRYVPGSVFEHDRFGICRVADVAVSAPNRLNVEALRNALQLLLKQWEQSGAADFPDPLKEWDEYQVGVPDRVDFEPFPLVVQCNNCGHINFLNVLSEIKGEPLCTNCRDGMYRQLPYVMIHGCGKLGSIYVPNCQIHRQRNVRFNDTGRFVTSWWTCASCNGAMISRMRQVPCGCSYGRQADDPNMRYVRTNDTSVLYSHSVTFVNLQESLIAKLRNDPRSTGLLLARLWDLLGGKATELAARREASSGSSTADEQTRVLLQQLLNQNPDSDIVKQLANRLTQEPKLPGDEVIDQVDQLIGGGTDAPPSRSLLESVAIRDTLDVIRTEQAAENARQRGDSAGAYDIEAAVDYARNVLGINSIECITNFPLALAAAGYSRVDNRPQGTSSRPGQAYLRPFRRARGEGGKTPLYVVTSETEAIMVQLDPFRIAQWLIKNKLALGPEPEPGFESWAWCRQHLKGLSSVQGLFTLSASLTPAETAVLTLLHTISHLLLGRIEWSGFDPESVGEYILPESLTAVIHSNNYNSFTIGGMVTMFEQRLYGWLQDTRNAAFTCTYNPICEDEGASCSGCLHRQHNCLSFNDLLSRATLTGGRGAGISEIAVGYWTMAT
ncbi:MAG TPA: hypothetical protein VF543_02955 [Pyrinomonadaceae bacterium]|jgi:hypothetical protein